MHTRQSTSVKEVTTGIFAERSRADWLVREWWIQAPGAQLSRGREGAFE